MSSGSETPTELWREIPGTDGRYQASNQGRVRVMWHGLAQPVSADNSGRLLDPYLDPRGFFKVTIGSNVRSIADCVLSAFVGPRPGRGWIAGYINGNKKDPCLQNIKWIDPVGVRRHTRAIGSAVLRPVKESNGEKLYQCTVCKNWRTEDGFYALARTQSKYGNPLSDCGLASECRQCSIIRRREHRRKYGNGSAPSRMEKLIPVLERLNCNLSLEDQNAAGIGAYVAAARKRKLLSALDLAELAGVRPETIDRLEGGKTLPRANTLETIIRAIRGAASDDADGGATS